MKILYDAEYGADNSAERAAYPVPNRVGRPDEAERLCGRFIDDERPVARCGGYLDRLPGTGRLPGGRQSPTASHHAGQ
jgi:hypothetical protein